MGLDFRIPRDRAIMLQNTIASGGSEADSFIQYLNASGETIDESNKGYSSVQIDYALSIFATCTNCIIDLSGTNDHRTEASNDDLNTGLAAGNTYTLNDVLGAELHTDLNAANDSATEAITAFADHSATIDGSTKVTIGQDITAMLPQGAIQNVSNCVNDSYDDGVGGGFANGTPTGFDAVSDGAGNDIAGTADEISITAGFKYVVKFDEVLNSGTAPNCDLRQSLAGGFASIEGVQLSAAGANTFVFTASMTTTCVFQFWNESDATDYEITNLSVKELEVLGADLVTDGDFGDVTKAAAKGVAGITKAAPAVVTFDAGHGYIDGNVIYFSGLTEMTELNTEYWVLRSNAGDTFELQTTVGNSLDTSGYGAAETTGGTVAQHTTLTSWIEGVGWNPGVDGAGALTGTANCDGTQGAPSYLLQSSVYPTDYATYLIKFTISNYSAGTIKAGGTGSFTAIVSGDGTYTSLYIAGTSATFRMLADEDFIGSIDNVSVHQLLVTKEIAASTNYTGDHYVLPVDVNNFAIPVDYTAEAIVAQLITGETDATTGWTAVGLTGTGANVFESQSTVVNEGSFALRSDANDTPTDGTLFQNEFTVDNGSVYRTSIDWRHIGTGGTWGFRTYGGDLSAWQLKTSASTTFETLVYYTTQAVATTLTLQFKEYGGTNNGGVYVDAISIKKVTFT